MIRKVMAPQNGQVQVTFELPSCIWADRIVVTGDFNEWSDTATPLRQGRDGVWRVSINLPAGRRFEFRYLVDGQWQTDYHADGWAANAYDSQNSIVDTNLFDVEVQSRPAPGYLLREAAISSSVPRPAVDRRKVIQAAA